MANVQHPGFFPARRYGGAGTITYARRRTLTNNTNAINLQDAVIIDANGDTIRAATGTIAVDSIAMGVSYLDANSQRVGAKNLPATTLYTSTGVDPANASYTFVVENPANVVLRCSVDEAIAMTDLNLNYAIVLSNTAVNGISQQELDATGRATTNTLPIRVLEFVFAGDNDVDAADAHVYATINAGMSTPSLSASTGT
jgi:hypothetical protein